MTSSQPARPTGDQQGMGFHSDALFWPTVHARGGGGAGDMKTSAQEGGRRYVIGWQHVEIWNSGDLSSTNSMVEQGAAGRGGSATKLARTTICACILPAKSGYQEDSTGYSLDEINEALQQLSSRYQCQRQVDNGIINSNDSSSGDEQHMICSCCTCGCIRSLKVVAVWEDGESSSSATTRTKDTPGLPCIQKTPMGPWWKDYIMSKSSSDGDDDDENSTFRELIWYDPLGHYKLDGSTPSELGNTVGFRRTLIRLSESPNIAEELTSLLQDTESSSEDQTVSRVDQSNIETTEEIEPPDTRLQRLLNTAGKSSLAAIHCINKTPFLSRIPIIYSLQCLAQFIKGSSAKRNICGKFIPSEIRSGENLSHASKLGHAVLDGILGLAVGLFFIRRPDSIRFAVSSLWEAIHGHLLREKIGWLETFPVGFKLNVPLTTNMGREIILVVSTYEQVLSIAFGPPAVQILIVYALGLTGLLLGFGTVAALIFDAIRLSTIHIHTISIIFSRMFRAILYTLSSLWKLFRGKKKNVLRHRTDTSVYDFMQLLLGTMLFTTCLFLFTTVLVYYTFFTVVNISVAGCTVIVWMIYSIVQAFPLGIWLIRVSHSDRFPRTVYFSHEAHEGHETNENILVSSLVPVAKPATRVFTAAYGPIFSRFFSCIPTVLGEIFSGTPSTITSTCLGITSLSQNQLCYND